MLETDLKRKLSIEGNIQKDRQVENSAATINFIINQNQISLYQGNDVIYLDIKQFELLQNEFRRFEKMMMIFGGCDAE